MCIRDSSVSCFIFVEYFWSMSLSLDTRSSHRCVSTFLSSISWSIKDKCLCMVASYSFRCSDSCCLCSLSISRSCIVVNSFCWPCSWQEINKVENPQHFIIYLSKTCIKKHMVIFFCWHFFQRCILLQGNVSKIIACIRSYTACVRIIRMLKRKETQDPPRDKRKKRTSDTRKGIYTREVSFSVKCNVNMLLQIYVVLITV